VAPERRVWAVGVWAAGLGRRAGARGGAGAPHPGGPWLVAAAQLHGFAPACRHDVRVWTWRAVRRSGVPLWPPPSTRYAAGTPAERGAPRARCARLPQRRASPGPVSPLGGTIASVVMGAFTAAERSRPTIRTLQVHDPRFLWRAYLMGQLRRRSQ
jgi:hypothetical protein